MLTILRNTSLAVIAFASAASAFAQDVIVETVEDDNVSTEVNCGDRLNRPVVVTDSAGNSTEVNVNTQHIVCADTSRTFEILSEGTGG